MPTPKPSHNLSNHKERVFFSFKSIYLQGPVKVPIKSNLPDIPTSFTHTPLTTFASALALLQAEAGKTRAVLIRKRS